MGRGLWRPPRAGSKAPGQAVGGGENRSPALSEEGVVRDLFWGGALNTRLSFYFLMINYIPGTLRTSFKISTLF